MNRARSVAALARYAGVGVLGVQGDHVVVTLFAHSPAQVSWFELPGLLDGVGTEVPQVAVGLGYQLGSHDHREHQDESDGEEEPSRVAVARAYRFHWFLR